MPAPPLVLSQWSGVPLTAAWLNTVALVKLGSILPSFDDTAAMTLQCSTSRVRVLLPQESKAQAISARAVQCVLPFLASADTNTCQLSFQVIASLAQLFQGRLAILQASGLKLIISALETIPEAGARCLQVLTVFNTVTSRCPARAV